MFTLVSDPGSNAELPELYFRTSPLVIPDAGMAICTVLPPRAVYSSSKFAFTFVPPSLRVSPVPSLARVPIFKSCFAI